MGWTIGIRFPEVGGNFLFTNMSGMACGLPSLLFTGYRGLFPWVKNAWSCTSTPPYVFIMWCLVKTRYNFTFTFTSYS